ncbi:MAG: dihydrolipoyl dehydrogenase [Chloroflexota bacterium]|nr:MAG: dihydrolipoyl dehydrogenase [Chloroflexota bacterium]
MLGGAASARGRDASERVGVNVARQCDIAVVGGGPGGYVAAIRAAQGGASVILIEREHLGGTCLNVGCIPSKALLASAERLHELRSSAALGIRVTGEIGFDWAAVMNHKERTIRQLRGGVEALVKSNGIELIRGSATLMARDRLRVASAEGSVEVAAKNIILATGSSEARPPIPGSDLAGVIGSAEALSLDAVPSSIAVIGGGALGCEFASIYHHFGSRVTVIEMLPSLLPLEDADIGAALGKSFARQGIDVKVGAKVTGMERAGEALRVGIEVNGQSLAIDAEVVLIAVGRVPNTEGLGLDRIGVTMDRRAIAVDAQMRTNVPGLWAVGDVTGKIMLAHVAMSEAEVAVDNALGGDREMDYGSVPSCTYTIPQAASVGLTEAKARAKGRAVKVGTFPFQAIGRAIAGRDTEGFVKVVADEKYGRILGVHVIHSRAGDLIEEAVVAMKLESSIEDLVAAIHPHPTLSEAIAEAALAVDDRAIHMPRVQRRA